ncbi:MULTISPECIES: YdiY family protein [Marinomonas]|uniref:Putative salt-induced outer membrane protein YdiY n=1 Tax=Marinomonas alcarazii TaxID=491949 RepID=A0A318V6C5_9GAMM|nr:MULTISPECIES: DUF481 domain-containing protein [Marinomonas]PYF83371.1 putative salt-induced outer membrane protein YdiY [Marinomonas alcarazii]
MKPLRIVVLAFGACFATLSYAEKSSVPLEPLSLELELGLISTTGNMQSTALKTKATIKQDFREWKAKYQADVLYKRGKNNDDEETQTTAHKTFLSAQSDYKLAKENSSVFVYGSYTDDRFSGYEYQNTLSVGYSGRIYEDESSFLDYSAGPGYSFSQTDAGEEEKNAIIHIELQYEYEINPNVTFQQGISTDTALESDKNSTSKSETSFNVKLRDNLQMKAVYSLTHNSIALEDKKKTDGIASVIFSYSF